MADNLNPSTLECLRRETADNPTASVIWLHGLGADATDFEPLVPMLDLSAHVRFIFPNAPVRPVTINGGMEMRAWYDIDPGAPLAGGNDIKNSVNAIRSIVEEEMAAGIPSERIALAGFSQGGVVALELGLSFSQPLAGIMALSTYLHDHEQVTERLALANVDTPIFMAHGISDPVIPITRAITSREALIQLNYRVQWHEYAMGHQVCPQEITHISQWLSSIHPN
jgi:phospholipase/carboxylesterase